MTVQSGYHVHDGASFVQALTAFDTAPVGGIYYLTDDLTSDGIMVVNDPVTICLNGHTWDINGYTIAVGENKILNICDCSGGGGMIVSTSPSGVIHNSGGTLNILDGVIKSTGNSPGISNFNNGILNISGGTVIGETNYGIKNEATVYLFGTPVISGGTGYADIYTVNGIYADDTNANAYNGGVVSVTNATPTVDTVLVQNVTSTNASLFEYVGKKGYYLELDTDKLKLNYSHEHTWNTEWTVTDTHHWHECLETQCTATDDKSKDGYAAHSDGNFDFDCDACGKYIGAFENISVSLGEDITVKYFIAQSNLISPEMRFTVNGYTKTVQGILESGQYKFIFDGVAPQWIGDTIKAELLVDGVVIESKNYSVLEYLNTLKSKTAAELEMSTAKYNAMQTLIADLLVYGGAAQVYTNHNTGELVSNGVTGNTAFVNIGTTDAGARNGSIVTFTGATVFYDSVNTLMFKFTATDLAGVTLRVKVNNGEEIVLNYINNGDGTYTVKTDAVKATGFDDVYTLIAYKDNTEDAVLTYSVKSYVYAKQNDTSNAAELAKALYNYGIAAKAFQNAV